MLIIPGNLCFAHKRVPVFPGKLKVGFFSTVNELALPGARVDHPFLFVHTAQPHALLPGKIVHRVLRAPLHLALLLHVVDHPREGMTGTVPQPTLVWVIVSRHTDAPFVEARLVDHVQHPRKFVLTTEAGPIGPGVVEVRFAETPWPFTGLHPHVDHPWEPMIDTILVASLGILVVVSWKLVATFFQAPPGEHIHHSIDLMALAKFAFSFPRVVEGRTNPTAFVITSSDANINHPFKFVGVAKTTIFLTRKIVV